jgi:hypothetical protein
MKRLRQLWDSLRARYAAAPRVVQLAAMTLGGFVAIMGVYTPLARFNGYRTELRREIETNRAELDNVRAYVARAEGVGGERELLSKRLEGLNSRLIPGNTGTLAAAHLQDLVTTVAGETAVSVQSAQVMREERAGAYRQVTVRLTARATLKALADFLERLEYGTMQISVPFLQIDRRGAVRQARPNARPGPEDRILSATIEVRGLMVGSSAGEEEGGAASGRS